MDEGKLRTALRCLIALAVTAIGAGALISVDARTTGPKPRIITATEDGKPILLGRMVVTATPLPAEE